MNAILRSVASDVLCISALEMFTPLFHWLSYRLSSLLINHELGTTHLMKCTGMLILNDTRFQSLADFVLLSVDTLAAGKKCTQPVGWKSCWQLMVHPAP